MKIGTLKAIRYLGGGSEIFYFFMYSFRLIWIIFGIEDVRLMLLGTFECGENKLSVVHVFAYSLI